jgi:L-lysine exporter family protein LysE/ArgO
MKQRYMSIRNIRWSSCGARPTVVDVTSAVAGFLSGLSLIVAIGAQNAFVLRQGIRREHVGAVVAVCVAADVLLISAGVGGLGALVDRHPAALAAARYGGAAFLVILAAAAVRRARVPGRLDPASTGPVGLGAVLTTCVALTFLNPHVYLDTVVLLGSLAGQQDAPWGFAAGASVASAVWFSALGLGATRLRPLFARPRAWQVLDLVVAAVMVTLAVLLVA